jgi:hypothetical protein
MYALTASDIPQPATQEQSLKPCGEDEYNVRYFVGVSQSLEDSAGCTACFCALMQVIIVDRQQHLIE